MKPKIFVLIIFMFFSYLSKACEVHLPGQLLILSETANILQAANQTNCTEEILNEVNKTVSSLEGRVTAFQLSDIMKAKNHDVVFQPNIVEIQQLKNLIRDQILMPPGVQLRSSEALNAQSFISLSSGDRVELLCDNCLFGTQQPINVNIRAFDGTHRSIVVKADFKRMVRAFKLTSFHPAFSDISASSLKEEFVESIPHTDLITDLDKLKFYKLNKPVKAGELLRLSDLNAINLVRAGTKTEVLIENDLVLLKTSGISRSNGTLGEYVEVFHPQKNKKYYGKVIDLNKVRVEL